MTMSGRDDRLWRDSYGTDQVPPMSSIQQTGSWSKFTSLLIPAIVFVLGLGYSGLYALDFNLLSLRELVWNLLVHITPSRLIISLSKDANSVKMAGTPSEVHAAKSETMRRLLGFDRAEGIMGTVAQAGRRRLSSISGGRLNFRRDDSTPPGLGNWDNSCYQNSVLQGLASLESLPEYLSSTTDHLGTNESTKPSTRTADSLHGLLAQLTDTLNNGKRIWTPAALKSMSSWQQQDAQEYYSKILDEIDKEIAGLTKIQAVTKSFRPELMLSQFGQQRSTLRTVENTPTSGLRNPLEGLLAQRVGCTECGYSEGLSMIPFNCLTVPLGKAFSYDVSDCLNEYTKLETIPGVECGKCTLLKTQRLLKLLLEKSKSSQQDDTKRNTIAARHQAVTEALEDDDYEERTLTQKCHLPRQSRMNTNKSRQAVIARPPQSLVVHVNRSLFDERTGDLKKNYAEVHFPKSLDLGPWCLGSVGNTTDKDCEEWLLNPTESMIVGTETQSKLRGPLYELRAVITHYGRHENGHYICYRKHPFIEDSKDGSSVKEQWWRLSDDDVSKVTEDNVLSQSGVFMLFYDCVEGTSFVNSRQETSEKTSVPESVDDTVLAIDTPLSINEGRGVTNLDTDMEPKAAMAVEDVAAVTSDDEDDTSAADYSYEPAKPIHIPGRVRGKEVYAEDDVQGARLQAPSMVMV